MISCKLGQSAGKAASIEATATLGRSEGSVNAMLMVVVLGERSKGMNWTNSPVVDHKLRVFIFGNKGSPMA